MIKHHSQEKNTSSIKKNVIKEHANDLFLSQSENQSTHSRSIRNHRFVRNETKKALSFSLNDLDQSKPSYDYTHTENLIVHAKKLAQKHKYNF